MPKCYIGVMKFADELGYDIPQCCFPTKQQVIDKLSTERNVYDHLDAVRHTTGFTLQQPLRALVLTIGEDGMLEPGQMEVLSLPVVKPGNDPLTEILRRVAQHIKGDVA